MKLSIFSLLIFISFKIIAQATPYEIVQNMGRGINLGNTLSAPDEGSWAPIVHESFFEDVKNEGFMCDFVKPYHSLFVQNHAPVIFSDH